MTNNNMTIKNQLGLGATCFGTKLFTTGVHEWTIKTDNDDGNNSLSLAVGVLDASTQKVTCLYFLLIFED